MSNRLTFNIQMSLFVDMYNVDLGFHIFFSENDLLIKAALYKLVACICPI